MQGGAKMHEDESGVKTGRKIDYADMGKKEDKGSKSGTALEQKGRSGKGGDKGTVADASGY
jgi:hypothetical protein